MASLSELLGFVEAATGPDRPLDRLLWEALDERWVSPVPFYTASIDAAVALVEKRLPGWSWEARRSGFGSPAMVTIWNPMQQPMPGYDFRASNEVGSVPLAILAALLRSELSRSLTKGETDAG